MYMLAKIKKKLCDLVTLANIILLKMNSFTKLSISKQAIEDPISVRYQMTTNPHQLHDTKYKLYMKYIITNINS